MLELNGEHKEVYDLCILINFNCNSECQKTTYLLGHFERGLESSHIMLLRYEDIAKSMEAASNEMEELWKGQRATLFNVKE